MSLALLLSALLVLSTGAEASKPQPTKVMRVGGGMILRVAMDWPRVAYASGGRIYVWNVATGATSVVKGTYSNGTHSVDASQLAIAGTRVPWIKRQGFGNTEEGEKLYTASIVGRAHMIKQGYLQGRQSVPTGGWIVGVVGSGKVLAVSTWKSNHTASSHERLNLITTGGLRPIVTGPGAIVAEAARDGHIAVLRSTASWPSDAPATPTTEPTVGIYSTRGTLHGEIVLDTPVPPPPSDYEGYDPSTIQNSIALSGNWLVVLTRTDPYEGHWTAKIQVYDWTTGALLQTWPLSFRPLGVSTAAPFAAYGRFAAVQGGRRLHVIDLRTGKVPLTVGDNWSPAAMGAHGLVYGVSFGGWHPHGRLVFVPMAKLIAMAG